MPHPKYGERYTCFQCGTKFFDMKKPEPLCPKCGADQRKAPKKPVVKTPKQPVIIDEYDTEEEGPILEDIGDFHLDEEEGAAGFDPDSDRLLIDDVPDEDEY